MINLQAQFKTKEEIRSLAPSIFTETGASNVSENYTHIPTYKIIDDMELLGWKPIDAKEVKARKSIGYQKHLIVFRNEDIFINGEDGDNVFPQILLTNSHDGKNAFTFTAGLFRMVCENGLVLSTKEFENIKIRHYGYNFEELQNTIEMMVNKLPLTIDSMNRFKQIQLGQDQMMKFAEEAVKIRFNNDIDNIKIDLGDLLTPTRIEDRGNDLWSVFNVVQEKLTHGGFNYNIGSKNRKARKIKNFKQDLDMNIKLHDLALEYAN
jgi:hypothetical protein